MSVKELNLVKYAGEYWVTLADFTETRDVGDYSNEASVKSAVRTFVVRNNPEQYIAFRGEVQIRNIIQENRNNPMFRPEDFQGHTRTALIHWDMLEALNERFEVSKEYKDTFYAFMEKAAEIMTVSDKSAENNISSISSDGAILQERSTMLRYLRNELQKMDKEVELLQSNREKILQAINSLESLELPEI